MRRFNSGGLCGLLTLVACSGGGRTYNELVTDAAVDASVIVNDAARAVDSGQTNTLRGDNLTVTLDRVSDASSLSTTHDAGQEPRNDGGSILSDADSSNISDVNDGKPDAEAPSDAGVTLESSTSSDPGSTSPTSSMPADAGQQCQPTGEEACFNQHDDDCNGLTDCEDPACTPSATCEPAGTTQGLLVEQDAACPPGYVESVELHQGLNATGCAGCTCSVTNSQCSGELYFYELEGDCDADINSLSGGVLVDAVTAECPQTPHMEGFTSGYRVGAIELVQGTGTCTPSGTATLNDPSWLVTMKYCIAEAVGGGCEPDYACVPQHNTGTTCAESESECIGGQVASTWYEAYLDERTCGECSCDGAGGCGDVQIELGSDWACDVGNPGSSANEQRCDITPYSPPAMLVGAPTQPACAPNTEPDGNLTPLGNHSLCCAQ